MRHLSVRNQTDYHFVLNQIKSASSIGDLHKCLFAIAELYHLQNAVYHAVRMPRSRDDEPLLILTYDQAWVRRYNEREYQLIDPVVQSGKRGFLPIDWSQIDWSGFKSDFFLDAQSYGVGRHGLSLPINGSQGDRAIFSVTSNGNDTEWQLLRKLYLGDLQLLAFYFHDQAATVSGGEAHKVLSSREIECLTGLGRGGTPKTVAGQLGISESAVRLYLNRVRTKFRCATTTQAVCLAVQMNLIEV